MKKILVVANRRDYTAYIFKMSGVDIVYSYISINWFVKLIRAIHFFLRLPFFSIWFAFDNKIAKKYDLIVVYECSYSNRLVKFLKEYKNPKTKIVYWLWNSVDKENKTILYDVKKDIEKMKKENIHVYSFDRYDCDKYAVKYHNQVLKRFCDLKVEECDNDVYFCGQAKDRYNYIIKLTKILREKGIGCDITIISNDDICKKENDIKINKNEISYCKILDGVLKSRSILDIVQQGQGGITWRPLEALYYHKKLITNFKDIVNYDFYNRQNIFVLGVDDMRGLCEFINSPYKDVDENIIKKYTPEGWLESLIKKECKSEA